MAITVSTSDVRINAGEVSRAATWSWPQPCSGVGVFAHGSGSRRFSPRNRWGAASLQNGGLATLWLDLLTPEEARTDPTGHGWWFDSPLLAERLTDAVDGTLQGTLGEGDGLAALITAAARPPAIGALICRSGRPELARGALARVRGPTLFIVGGADREVLALNERAASTRTAPHHVAVVTGASHLFPEACALQAVCRLARDGFGAPLQPPSPWP